MLKQPENGAGGWHHCLSAQPPAEQQLCSWAHMRTELPHLKTSFTISPPFSPLFPPLLPLLAVTLPLSCCLSLLLCPSVSSLHCLFSYTIYCHHLSRSVRNPAQSLWSFPKVSQKILAILPQCHMVPCGSAFLCQTASSPRPLVLRVLPAVVVWGSEQETSSRYQRGKRQ